MSNIELLLQDMDNFNDRLTDYTKELQSRADESKLLNFCEMRKMPLDVVKESDIFYIGDATEMLLPSYLGLIEDFGVISPTNKKPIFHNRYVMPIKNEQGKVINLVGYSKDADERYVYGTAKYYRRRDTLYGLENMHLAYKYGYAILTEGITDTIRVRSLGFKNSFANCGTHGSAYITNQLNRCRHGVVTIPDRDSAGQRALSKWNYNRSITLYVYIKYKDIDEMCKDSDDNIEIVKEYLTICEDWIKSIEHYGLKAGKEVITIL